MAEEGKTLIALDYSQIELRILAHIAGIDTLKQAFKDGHDIHAMTASEIFDVPLEDTTPANRRRAKAANFGVASAIPLSRLPPQLPHPAHSAPLPPTAPRPLHSLQHFILDDHYPHVRQTPHLSHRPL